MMASSSGGDIVDVDPAGLVSVLVSTDRPWSCGADEADHIRAV